MRGDRLETVSSPLLVLIIESGLGGLCLAQGLKKSGISVAVYERDSSAQFRNQGCMDSPLGVNLRSRPKKSVPEQPKREARLRQTC